MSLSIEPSEEQSHISISQTKFNLWKFVYKSCWGERVHRILFMGTAIVFPFFTVIVMAIVYHQSISTAHRSCSSEPTVADGTHFSTEPLHADGTNRQPYARSLRKLILNISEDDSLGMIIDLPDSLVLLLCEGVQIRSCPIVRYRLFPSRHMFGQRSGELSSTIFTKTSENATISKVPIRVKNAPRDTVAAAKESLQDEVRPPREEQVAVTMRYSHDLKVNLHQVEPYNIRSIFIGLPAFLSINLWTNCRQLLAAICHGSMPHVNYCITLDLARDDATILYRATPASSKLIIMPEN